MREPCVTLRRAVQGGVQKICNGICSVDYLLPCKIHCKILLLQHTEVIRNLTSEVLGVAGAGNVCSLGMKSSNTKRLRGWWPCRGQVSLATAEVRSRKGWKALLWGRVLSAREGPPGPPSVIPFLRWKHVQRHLQCVRILSRMRVKCRELLPRLEKRGICFFFLIKNWDRRVVAVELLRLTFSLVRKGRGGRERTGSSV